MYRHTIHVTDRQLQAMFAIFQHVRLGEANQVTSEFADFYILCESLGIDDILANLTHDYGGVKVDFEYNESEGFVLNLVNE
jgi:hypothetical protein